MKVEFKIQDSVGIVQITGDLNVVYVDELRQQFKDWFQSTSGLKFVVTDMGAVSSIDSAGLGVLIAMFKQVQTQGGELLLCGLNKKVRMVFQLTRVHQIFTIYDDLDESLRNCV